MPISKSNNRGFTLVELMVAVTISLISLFALLSALQTAGEVTAKNLQREEAVQIAANRMNRFRATPFAMISTSYPVELAPPTLRGTSGLPPFRVVKSSVNLSPSSKLVDVRVRWIYKNISTSHEVQSVVQQ